MASRALHVGRIAAVFVFALMVGRSAVTDRVGAQAPAAVGLSFRYAETIGETEVPYFRGAAHINRPWGLASAGDDVLIADGPGRRVLRFSSNGRYVYEIGRSGLAYDIHDAPVRWLSDVAVWPTTDGKGNDVEDVYLADALGHYVLIVSGADGSTRVLGEPGVPGSDDDHFTFPAGLALDSSGHLYVSDGAPPPGTCGHTDGNQRVQVFAPDGALVATIGQSGVAGRGEGQLDGPVHVFVDHQDRLYVADSGNHRVQVFDVSSPTAPAYLSTLGQTGAPGAGADRLRAPLGVAVDATFVYVADSGNCRVQIFRRRQQDLWASLGSAGGCAGSDDALTMPADVALDAQAHIYVADAGHRQVKQYRPTREELHTFGSYDTPYVADDQHYNHPAGVAVVADGSVYIAEEAGHRVVKRDAAGDVVWTFGVAGVAGGDDARLDHPTDVAVGDGDRVYVADSRNARIQVLDAGGDLVGTFGGPGTGTFDCPQGVGVSGDGRVAVADSCNHRVQILDDQGRQLATLGTVGQPGAGDDRFDLPLDAEFDARGYLYVADSGNHRVQIFDAGLRYTGTLGQTGVPGDSFDARGGSSAFHHPRRLAVDGDDNLYVADGANDRVQVFEPSGRYLTTVGGRSGTYTGTRTGELRDPHGVAVDVDGRLYIADYDNHRVQMLDRNTEPWSQDNLNGFARRGSAGIWSSTSFANDMYVGAYDAELGGSVWRQDDPDAADGWRVMSEGGFGDPDNVGVSGLAVLGDHVYAATANLDVRRNPATGAETVASPGGELWRSGDGLAWEPVMQGGFGNEASAEVSGLFAFDDRLYAGTRSIDDEHGTEVWRSATGETGSWERVAVSGFDGDESNEATVAFAVHAGALYAGTCNLATGGEVWYSADGRAWAPSIEGGFGRRQNGCVSALASFGGKLYAATGNEPSPGTWSPAVQVWRCETCDGTDWEQTAPDGFGDADNVGRTAMHVFDETPFQYLYIAVGNHKTGLEVWRATDGELWEQIALAGFGDSNNTDVHGQAAFAVHDGRLHVGTLNGANGGELWSTAGARPGVVPTPGPGPRPTATPRPRPKPITGKTEYVAVDQWPRGEAMSPDVMGDVVDMDIADDGAVYLLDASLNRVMSLGPSGKWGTPFGNAGRGPDRIGRVGALGVDSVNDRVYVADHASERLLVYGRDGTFVDVWPEIYATGIEVQADGRLWIADRLAGAVRLLEPDGTEARSFGAFGNAVGSQFQQLMDVTVDADGSLIVSDLDGERVRVFRDETTSFRRIRTLDLTQAKFAGCDGSRLTALGPDPQRFMATGCVIFESTREDVFPLGHRSADLYGVNLWTANPSAGHYRALAVYDADRDNPENDTWPAVVQYFDDGFDIVVRHWRGRHFDEAAAASGAISAPVRLSTAPDGTLMLTDDFGLRRLAHDGRLVAELPTTAYPSRLNRLIMDPTLTIGEGRDGRVMGIGRERWLRVVVYAETEYRRYCRARYCEVNPYLKTIWSSTLPRETEGVAAVAHEPTENQFLVLRRHHASPSRRGVENIIQVLTVYPLGDRGRKNEFELDGTDRDAIWTDVDATTEGRIYVLDTFNDRVQVLSAELDDLGMVPTPKDAYRVAGAPNGEIFVLTVYGHVVRLAADGTVLARFDARPHAGLHPISLVDLAVDQHSWVYVVDEDAGQVAAFEPRGISDDALVGETCSALGDKWVAPTDILLGDTAEVFLAIFGSCGAVEVPSDIVLAVNTLGRTLGNDPGRQLARNLRVARKIAALTDLDRHRLAVLAFATEGVVETELTDQSYQIVRALWSVNAGRGQPRAYTALRTAQDLFDYESDRRRVLIIVIPGNTDDAAIALAQEMKADGTLIVVVNGASVIASGDLFNDVEVEPRGAGAGKPAHRRMSAQTSPDVLFQSGTLIDRVPDNIDYVTGSASPAANWSASTRTLTWDLADLPLSASTFQYEIEPLEEGEWPTNVEARADYVDGWGHPGRLDFPVPRIRVYGELPPTPTPSPTPTATPEPTPTPRPPVPVYLPLALMIECTPDDRNADVAIVIDTSGSMSDPTSEGGPTKLEAAREAARDFVTLLNYDHDQAAILQFNTEAKIVVPLTADRQALLDGLDALTQQSGTRIDLALELGLQALQAPESKPDNNAVLILLTDGVPTGTTTEEVLAAAKLVHEAEILTFTIGLGPAVDQDLLRAVASRPDWFFYAPDTSDLSAIYEQIAFSIPCPRVWP